MDEETKIGRTQQMRLQNQGELFTTNEEWKGELAKLHSMRVLKMPKIL